MKKSWPLELTQVGINALVTQQRLSLMTTIRFNVLRSTLIAALATVAFAASAGDMAAPAADSAKDRTTAESAFTKADANKDGRLSKEEAAMYPAVASKFEELDKDKKGYISLEQFSSAMSAEPAPAAK
jgi:EF hand